MSAFYEVQTLAAGAGSTEFERCALLLLKNGYSPVPLKSSEKRPLLDGWDRLRATPLTKREIAQISADHPAAGLGVAGGFNRLVPIDIDTDDPEIVAAVEGVLPEPLVAKRGRRGSTRFYRDSSGVIRPRKFKTPDGTMLVEILVTGQTVVPPTIHPETGRPYVYSTDCSLFDVHVHELPELAADVVERLEKALRRWLPPPKAFIRSKAIGAQPESGERMRAYAQSALSHEAQALRATPKGGRNPQLYKAGCKLGKFVHHKVLSEEEFSAALLDAAAANGLIEDDGRKACQDTLRSALRKAEGDELPILDDWQFSAGARRGNGSMPQDVDFNKCHASGANCVASSVVWSMMDEGCSDDEIRARVGELPAIVQLRRQWEVRADAPARTLGSRTGR
jgi:hypothetical protein